MQPDQPETIEVTHLREAMHEINKSITIAKINRVYMRKKKAHVEIMNAPAPVIQQITMGAKQLEEQLADLEMKREICAKMIDEAMNKQTSTTL